MGKIEAEPDIQFHSKAIEKLKLYEALKSTENFLNSIPPSISQKPNQLQVAYNEQASAAVALPDADEHHKHDNEGMIAQNLSVIICYDQVCRLEYKEMSISEEFKNELLMR